MFIGDVIMCRSFVVGRIIRKAMNAAKWMAHMHAVRVLEVARPTSRRTSDESGYPTNDHFSKSGRPTCGDAQRLGEEAR